MVSGSDGRVTHSEGCERWARIPARIVRRWVMNDIYEKLSSGKANKPGLDHRPVCANGLAVNADWMIQIVDRPVEQGRSFRRDEQAPAVAEMVSWSLGASCSTHIIGFARRVRCTQRVHWSWYHGTRPHIQLRLKVHSPSSRLARLLISGSDQHLIYSLRTHLQNVGMLMPVDERSNAAPGSFVCYLHDGTRVRELR